MSTFQIINLRIPTNSIELAVANKALVIGDYLIDDIDPSLPIDEVRKIAGCPPKYSVAQVLKCEESIDKQRDVNRALDKGRVWLACKDMFSVFVAEDFDTLYISVEDSDFTVFRRKMASALNDGWELVLSVSSANGFHAIVKK